MSSVSIEPALPALNVTHLERLTEAAEIVTLDGEVIVTSDADSDSLVAWMLVAKKLRELARRMEDAASAEMLARVRDAAGPITTEYATARESINRGSISGIASQRIRDILEKAAADGEIPWDVVDNLAPLQAHVTPAKISDYIDHVSGKHEYLAIALTAEVPEKRRSIKLEQRVI
jgi:hypothetical protein